MKARFFKNLLALAVAVAMAAAAQELCPPLWVGVKAPFLVAVAAYYCVRREAEWGAVAAVWCGVVQDGLDGMGWFFGAPLFAGFWAFCQLVIKKQMPDSAAACAAAAVALGLAHEVACWMALRADGLDAGVGARVLVARFLVFAGAAVGAALAAAFFAGRADLALGNVDDGRNGGAYEIG